MKSKLPNPTGLLVVATVLSIVTAAMHMVFPGKVGAEPMPTPRIAAHTAGYPPNQFNELLQRSIATLESQYSISARVRQSVDLFDKQPVGSGIYLESRSQDGLLYRFELRLQINEEVHSLLDVCDGRYLWQYRKLREDQTLTRLDLQRVAEVMENMGRMPQPGEVGLWPGAGGLAKLLGGLQGSFDFVTCEPTQLRQQLRAWKLQGYWRREKLLRLLPKQEKAIREGGAIDISKLPDHVPDHVVLFLGADDLFPYRIEYRRQANPKQVDPGQGDGPLLAAIDFFEVSLNTPIDPARFFYSPGNLGFIDQTDSVLQAMGLKK